MRSWRSRSATLVLCVCCTSFCCMDFMAELAFLGERPRLLLGEVLSCASAAVQGFTCAARSKMLSLKLLPGVRELLPGVVTAAGAFPGDFLPAGVFGPGVLTGVLSPGRTFLMSLTT